MSREEEPADERLLERLREAASADPSVRQLRQRYEDLRRDYETLLGRLADLEGRLSSEAPPRPPTLSEQLMAPLLRLRDEYVQALEDLRTVVTALEGIAAGTLKGQHAAAASGESSLKPRRVAVETSGSGFGSLLDFQERLSALDGVVRVTISTIDQQRATFIVELR
jgi:hypothetical protein